MLLVFDRWRKLLKAFYHEKKRHFDISKASDKFLRGEGFERVRRRTAG